MIGTKLCGGFVLAVALLFAASANAIMFMGTPNLVISDGDGDVNPTIDSIDTTGTFLPGDTITLISITITLTHTYAGDLAIELIAPDLTEIQLLARPGTAIGDEATGCPCGNGRNFAATAITFADGATSAETLGDAPPFGNIASGTYAPDADGWTTDITLLAEFIGLPAAGLWTLRVGDYANQDTGTVDSWELNLEAVPEPQTHAMVALGLAGLAFAGRKRK